MNKQRLRRFGIYAFCLTTTLFGNSLPFAQTQPMNKKPSAQEFYTEQLENERIALWEEIKNVFGVDLTEFYRTRAHDWWAMPQRIPHAGNTVEQLIYEVAQALGYNTDKIIIQFVTFEDNQAAVGVGCGKLLINTYAFPNLPLASQIFAIAQALCHLVNDDNGEKIAIISKLADLEKVSTKQNELFYRYCRFQVKRADMRVALTGVTWALLYREYAQYGMQNREDRNAETHPTFKERAALAQHILDRMN